jgi:DNA-binding transcriptional regulator YiaG
VIGHRAGGEKMMTRDESNETIVLDALRRFMINSDLSDQRISRFMGVEIETLRTWIAGTANPRKQSLNKIRSFLKWHGRKYVIT